MARERIREMHQVAPEREARVDQGRGQRESDLVVVVRPAAVEVEAQALAPGPPLAPHAREELVAVAEGARQARREPLGARSSLRLYLDSGWPNDNYEVTLSMVNTLVDRGFDPGVGVHHFAFPQSSHDETSWGARLHLPIQLFFGRFTRRAGN